MRTKKIGILLNPHSGAHSLTSTMSQIKKSFELVHIEPKILLARTRADIEIKVRRLLEHRYDVIVAAGGDGTVNAVAERLINTNVPLGIIPVGTFNHFARDLGIPKGINEAIALLETKHTKRVDVASVNGHYFLNNSSIGIYPQIVRQREELRNTGKQKWSAFAASLTGALRRRPFVTLHLDSPEKSVAAITPCVIISNNEYSMSGLRLGARARLDAHHLSVYFVRSTNRAELLRLSWHVLFGNINDQKQVDKYDTRELSIDTKDAGKKFALVAIDGEVIVLATPLQYRIHPAALTVITPSA